MKPILLSTERIDKGSYIIIVEHYDNDDLILQVLDFETKELLAYVDIVEEEEEGFNFNLN